MDAEIKEKKWVLVENMWGERYPNLSALTNENACKLNYEILDLKYQLTVTLTWFTYSWKRRENETISVMSETTSIMISQDEINDLAIFKKVINHDRQSENAENDISKLTVQYVEQHPELLMALVKRYAVNLREKLFKETYDLNSCRPKRERFSGYKNVKDEFLKSWAKQGEDTSAITTECVKKCILHAY